MATDQHGAKHLGTNAEAELHALFAQTLIDVEHHLAVHAAFDQWLTDHGQPNEWAEPTTTNTARNQQPLRLTTTTEHHQGRGAPSTRDTDDRQMTPRVRVSLPDVLRGSTSERGYGVAHQRLRRRVARLVAAGLVACWRCGLPIEPGSRWDLGHVDGDRSRYAGPEHARCNRATAGRRRRVSRAW